MFLFKKYFLFEKFFELGNRHTEYQTCNDDNTDCDRVNDFYHEFVNRCQGEFESAVRSSFLYGFFRAPNPTNTNYGEQCAQRQQQSVCQVFQEVAEDGVFDTVLGNPDTLDVHVNLRQCVEYADDEYNNGCTKQCVVSLKTFFLNQECNRTFHDGSRGGYCCEEQQEVEQETE